MVEENIYKDLQDYDTNIQTYIDELIAGKLPKCPAKKKINVDTIKQGLDDATKTITSNDSKVEDYYNVIRNAQLMFKLKRSIDNTSKNKRLLLTDVL